MMMRHQFPDHDDFAHEMRTSDVPGDDFDPLLMHDGPDPNYYRNAPRYDDGHVHTSSNECSTASSASRHTPDHSPKSTCTTATTVVHANNAHFSDSGDEERDAPEEVTDYRDDDGFHPHSVPEYGNDAPHAIGGPNSFVPIPFDPPPHHGFHQVNQYPNNPQMHHQQPMYSHPHHGYDANYHHHHYGPPPPHHHSAPPPHHSAPPHHYHYDQHPNDPSYYTNAFDAPIPDHYQKTPQPLGEVICIDDDDAEQGNSPVQVVGQYNDRDVLCGRGALMVWHPGNKFFRRLVQTNRQRYFFSRRQEKKKIATQIMEEVRAHGGRFLRRSQASDNLNQINVWVEIDEERAYQKTCQALREGAPEIRKQWRNKPTSRGTKTEETKENADNAASK